MEAVIYNCSKCLDELMTMKQRRRRRRARKEGITLSLSLPRLHPSISSPKSPLHLLPPFLLSLLLILSSFPALFFLCSKMQICLYLLPPLHPSCFFSSQWSVFTSSFSLPPPNDHSFVPPSPAGASPLLLPGGGRADLPGGLGLGSGWTQLHVVCSGTGPVRSGPGRSAQGPVCHPTAGLEGRATQVRPCTSI